MRRILLTSAGLTETMKQLFFSQINKKAEDIRMIFIPSASVVNDGAREGISMAMLELMNMGIRKENIFIYDLRYLLSSGYKRTYTAGIDMRQLPREIRLMTAEELGQYDAILFNGGNASFLMDEIIRTGFQIPLTEAVDQGLFYIGISAGSMVAAGNFQQGLRYIENPMIPHSEEGTSCGEICSDETIYLENTQAVWIDDEKAEIIE